MVDEIIVTVYDRVSGNALDLEIPANLTSESIIGLLGDNRIFGFGEEPRVLYSQKLNRQLKIGETLSDLGLWEGTELWLVDVTTLST